ncbi:COMPASS-like H3K4 histone methylase component WDR5A [Diplonema papillatum]|nr:COMPASS-like H3K4 histone methylase component WDR5A [Diplonema papillatum]
MRWVARESLRTGNAACYSVKWSGDDRTVASAGASGKAALVDVKTGRILSDTAMAVPPPKSDSATPAPADDEQQVDLDTQPVPVTCVEFCDRSNKQSTKLLASRSDGHIVKYDKSKCLAQWQETSETYSIAVSRDASNFISGGQDGALRLYDLNRPGAPVAKFSSTSEFEVNVHPVRIYAVSWSSHHDSMVASGGWESVKLWDTRERHAAAPVREFFGPRLVGHALDFGPNNTILTASHRPDAPLEVWEVSTGKLLQNVTPAEGLPFMPTFAAFSRSGKFIATGGGGEGQQNANAVSVVDVARMTTVGGLPPAPANVWEVSTGKLLQNVTPAEGLPFMPTFAAFSRSGKFIATGGGGEGQQNANAVSVVDVARMTTEEGGKGGQVACDDSAKPPFAAGTAVGMPLGTAQSLDADSASSHLYRQT